MESFGAFSNALCLQFFICLFMDPVFAFVPSSTCIMSWVLVKENIQPSLGPSFLVGEKAQKGGETGMKAVDWGGERATELRHPPQTSARLASLLNYFAFSPTAETSPRLIQPSSHFFLAFWSV